MLRVAVIAVALCLFSGGSVAANCPDGNPITARVCTLKQSAYNPVPNPDPAGPHPNPGYEPPDCDTASPPTSGAGGQLTKIQNAFNLAPALVQQDLCSLTKIFVNKHNDLPFGFWEKPNFHPSPPAPVNNRTFISIPASIIDGDQTFTAAQEGNFKALHLDSFARHREEIPTGTDPGSVGLLYIMAHELAHIKWFKTPPSCANRNFFSWTPAAFNMAQRRRWLKLGEHINGHNSPIPMPDEVTDPNGVSKLYNGGFVTGLAAASPIEDYVETYAVRALKTCADCKFFVTPNGMSEIQINDRRSNTGPTLGNKFDCVDMQVGALRRKQQKRAARHSACALAKGGSEVIRPPVLYDERRTAGNGRKRQPSKTDFKTLA